MFEEEDLSRKAVKYLHSTDNSLAEIAELFLKGE
jgi:hypothetical protein